MKQKIRDLTNFVDVDRLHKIMQRKFRYVHRMIASHLGQYLSFLLLFSRFQLFLSVCIFFSFILYFTFYYKRIWRNEKWISIVSLCSLMIHIFCYCFCCGGVKRVSISLKKKFYNRVHIFIECLNFLLIFSPKWNYVRENIKFQHRFFKKIQ